MIQLISNQRRNPVSEIVESKGLIKSLRIKQEGLLISLLFQIVHLAFLCQKKFNCFDPRYCNLFIFVLFVDNFSFFRGKLLGLSNLKF